jgi:type VI secretion system protein ImpJ
LLAAKSAALSGSRRQRNRGLAEFGAADVAQFWLLYTVNSFLPQLRHVTETRLGHPEPFYATLLALAGALTTFSSTPAHALPHYDHENLGRCFGQLDARIRDLLDTALPVNAVSLPLGIVRPSVYATPLNDERYHTASQLYLAVAADTERVELVRRVPQLVKVSSRDNVDALIRQGVPGVPLTHVTSLPGAVPVKLEFEYFAVATAGAHWEAIRRARDFAAYVPSDLGNPRLELVVVLGDRR